MHRWQELAGCQLLDLNVQLVSLLQLFLCDAQLPLKTGHLAAKVFVPSEFPLQQVLPVLVPELGYDDLAISDGSLASLAYTRMIDPDTEPAERNRLKMALLDYCRRDTEAMVGVYGAL